MQTKQQMQTSLKDFLFEAVKNPNSKIAPLIQTILVQDKNSTETEVSIEELKIIQANIKNEKEESEHLINTLLANCAVWGIGYTLDEKTLAFNLCQKACEQNYPLAHYVMARCLAWSIGCQKDLTAAIKHYKLAAKAGIVSAQRELGLIYEKSKIKELEKDPVTAAKLYEIADKQSTIIEAAIKTKLMAGIEKFFPDHLNPVGMRLSQEIRNVFRDFLEITDNNLTRETITLNITIKRMLANIPASTSVQNDINKIRSIHTDLKAKKKFDFLVDSFLAYCAKTGIGFKENETKLAYEYCKDACDNNYHMAQFVMAEYLFSNETNVKADRANRERALEYYTNASNNGISSAQVVMAKFYLKGYSNLIKKDLNRAVALLVLAAEQKNSLAYYHLGKLYEKGIGVKSINLYKAFQYYKFAAEPQFCEAIYSIGKCFEFGQGIDADFAHAQICFQMAAKGGYFRAKIDWLSVGKKLEAREQRIKLEKEEMEKTKEKFEKLQLEGDVDTYDKFLNLSYLCQFHDMRKYLEKIDWKGEINKKPNSWVCDNFENIILILIKKIPKSVNFRIIKHYSDIKGEEALINIIKKQNDEFLKVTGQYLFFSSISQHLPNLLKYLFYDRKILPHPQWSWYYYEALFLDTLDKKEMEDLSNKLMEKELEIYSETMGLVPKVFHVLFKHPYDTNGKGLQTLSTILQKGANPLFAYNVPTLNKLPVIPANYYALYGWATTIMAEYGGGLIKKDIRVNGDLHKLKEMTKMDVEKFKDSEIVLAARKQSNLVEIIWIYSAKKFGELLTGPNEDVMLPHASLIYQHIKDVIPESEKDTVAPEVRETIREQQKRGRLIFSTLKKQLPHDIAKECLSFTFIPQLADDCILTVLRRNI